MTKSWDEVDEVKMAQCKTLAWSLQIWRSWFVRKATSSCPRIDCSTLMVSAFENYLEMDELCDHSNYWNLQAFVL